MTVSKLMVRMCHEACRVLVWLTRFSEGGSCKAFALLEPQFLHISQDVIRSTWKTLPNSTEQKVQELLRSVERPVIARHVGERAQIEAQAALRSTLGTQVANAPTVYAFLC